MNDVFLTDFSQLQLPELLTSSIHVATVVITAFVEDSRGSWLLPQLSSAGMPRIIALHDAVENPRIQAIQSFENKYGPRSVLRQSESEQELLMLATEALAKYDNKLSVVVDLSCMSRNQMGYVLAVLKDLAANVIPIRLKMAYCLAKFSPPPREQHTFNRRVAPVHPVFSGWTTAPHLPIEVMVSLGYEKGKATGAVEYLEPRAKWVFVPNSPEERYLKEVKQHNRDLLLSTPKEKIIHYDVLQPLNTYYTLLSLVQGVSNDSRPVLLPFGPKLFFAISLLVAMSVESASVWHVDSADEIIVDQQPSIHHAILACTITSSKAYSTEGTNDVT